MMKKRSFFPARFGLMFESVSIKILLQLSLATLVLVSAFFAFSSAGHSATVTKLRKKKKIVYIDQGSEAGVEKGMKVCFKDSEGNKITCGKVRRVKKTNSRVRIRSRKKFKMIEKGGDAEVIDLATSGETPAAQGQTGGDAGGKFLGIRLYYLPSIITPTTYNKMTYLAPEADSVNETLWDKGKPSQLAIAAFGLEFELLSIGLASGIRVFRGYQEFLAAADYDRVDPTVYVDSIMKGSSFGFYLDYYFLSPAGAASGIRVGAGLDIDISKVDFIAELKDDDDDNYGGEIYRATSSQTVVSLRIPVSYEINIGGLGVDLGVNLLIPIYAADAKLDSVISDNNRSEFDKEDDEANIVAAEEDFLASMGHTKSNFGAEVLIGAFLAL